VRYPTMHAAQPSSTVWSADPPLLPSPLIGLKEASRTSKSPNPIYVCTSSISHIQRKFDGTPYDIDTVQSVNLSGCLIVVTRHGAVRIYTLGRYIQ